VETKETGLGEQATAAAGAHFDPVESMTQLYTSGIERLAEIQKKSLELTVQHNSEIMGAWKKQIVAAPGVLMLDLVTAAFERLADTQKGAIDLVVEQTHTLAGLMKERKLKASDAMGEVKNCAKEAIEHSIAAQKTAIDYSAKQAKAVFESAKQQLGYAGTPAGAAADSMQRGMEVLVEAHRELLDVMKEPVLH
jgi:hypothetical protein